MFNLFLSKDLVKDTNKILFEKSKDVKFPLSKLNIEIINKMISHVRISQSEMENCEYKLRPAVGIAAIQVGFLLNMFFIKVPSKENPKVDVEYALINPKMLFKSKDKSAIKYGEGCLSVDNDHEGLVKRSSKVTIKAYDYLQKKTITIKADHYLAIVLQHEMDHLQGKLYYQHINKKFPWDEEKELSIIE